MMKLLLAHKEILFLLLLVVISSVLPHPANITPIGALWPLPGSWSFLAESLAPGSHCGILEFLSSLQSR